MQSHESNYIFVGGSVGGDIIDSLNFARIDYDIILGTEFKPISSSRN